MIAAIIIAAYVAVGLAVGRWTALRRIKNGDWGHGSMGMEDNYMACGLATLFWPLAAAMYVVTMPPREPKRDRLAKRVRELEKELEL